MLLKYITKDTTEADFAQKLKQAESDETLSELKVQRDNFCHWLLKQDCEVKQTVAYSGAYSDLFAQQMDRLYKHWYDPRASKDPRHAVEVVPTRTWWSCLKSWPTRMSEPDTSVAKEALSPLQIETRELIIRAANNRDERRRKASDLHLKDIQATPDDKLASVYFNLGWNLYITRQANLAIKQYEQAQQIQPQNAAISNNMGNAYASLGKFEQAENMYKLAINLKPENAIFNSNLGWMYYKRGEEGDYACAEKCLKISTRNNVSSAEYHNLLGLVYYAQKSWIDAAREFNCAIILNPLDPVIYSNLASSYAEQNRTEDAIGTLNVAVQVALPEQKHLYNAKIGSVYADAKRSLEAIQVYETALESASQPFDQAIYSQRIGREYEKLEQWEQSAKFYSQALEQNPTSTDNAVNTIRAHTYLSAMPRDLVEQAENVCVRAATRARPQDPMPYYNWGMIYFYLNDYERAINKYWEAIRRAEASKRPSKEVARYYNQVALANRRLDHDELAIRYYNKAIELDPQSTSYSANLGLLLQARRRYDEAQPSLLTAYGQDAGNFNVILALIETYLYGSQPNIDKAIEFCQLAQQINLLNSPSPHELLGDTYILANQPELAIEEYNKALKLAVKQSDVIRIRKNLLKILKRCVTEQPTNIKWLERLASLQSQEQPNEAIENYTKAMQLAKADPQQLGKLYDGRGQAYYRMTEWEKAAKDWEVGLELIGDGDTKSALLHNNLGTAYDALKEAERALAEYQAASRLAPDNFVAHYNIGIALYRQKRYDLAVGAFQEAARLYSGFASISFNLGNCYYRLDYRDLADEKWQEAVQLLPSYSDAFYNLGVAASKRPDTERAGYYWKRALQTDQSHAQARAALDAVEAGTVSEIDIAEVKT